MKNTESMESTTLHYLSRTRVHAVPGGGTNVESQCDGHEWA